MNLETQKRISANLKMLRTCKNLSQNKMSEMLGVSRSLYVQYETGRRSLDAEVLYKISNRFGIDMGILFEANPQDFLNQISSSQFCSDELVELIELYRKLSPFTRGMLMEHALYLLDWDRYRKNNNKTLEERKKQWHDRVD